METLYVNMKELLKSEAKKKKKKKKKKQTQKILAN